MSQFVLRLTGDQHAQLKSHLFPGDGKEAVALALCGRLGHRGSEILCVHKILPIPYDACRERTPDRVTWPTDLGQPDFQQAAEKGMGVLKVHSHPAGFDVFSKYDDIADRNLFGSLNAWMDDERPNASCVMLPDGEMFGRFIDSATQFSHITHIAVAGDDIQFFRRGKGKAIDAAQLRTAQTFGKKTTILLKELRIAVVGCSGTGSWVIEQLARLGVGVLYLVDPDIVEFKNLNRIVNSSRADARERRAKVQAIKAAIQKHGTGTRVEVCQDTIFTLSVARDLASCDVLFGCMDSVEGRDILNRIAAFYCLPYFDLGVRLDADGQGGINNVSGAVHYLIPDGSSLISRGVYSAETLRQESLKRTNPGQYQSELEVGYIKGAKVESPAVVSVNGFCASMAINEFLGRIHPFRSANNFESRWQQFDLLNSCWLQPSDGPKCPALSKRAGRGDTQLFLDSLIYA